MNLKFFPLNPAFAHRSLDDDAVFGAAVRHVAGGEGPKAWSADEQAHVRGHSALAGAPLTGHSPAMAEIRHVIRQLVRHPDALAGYGYPGNVCELANLLDRAYALTSRISAGCSKAAGRR